MQQIATTHIKANSSFQTSSWLIASHLETVVPFLIHDYMQQGGPSEQDFARARLVYPFEIGSHGDALLFREKGQTSRILHMLADGVAILAFCPGGITLFGCHFEVKPLAYEAILTRQSIP